MNEWIPVKEKFPPKDNGNADFSITVLITDGENVSTGFYRYEYYSEDPEEIVQYEEDNWFDDSHVIKIDLYGYPQVTHWMHLPEAPRI